MRKKVQKFMIFFEVLLITLQMIFMGLVIIRRNTFDKKILLLISLSFIILNIIYFLLNREKPKGIFRTILIASIVFILVPMMVSYKASQDDFFDSSTSVGKLQQEIYDQSGVSVFVDVDVKEKRHNFIYYIDDYHVSNEDAIKYLTMIRDNLSIYSRGLPDEIYLINGFANKDTKLSGAYFEEGNYIVLKADDNLISNLHHEIGHSVEDKTFDLKSLIRFELVDSSCVLVSGYACTSNDELFAETWKTAILDNKTTKYSLAIKEIFKKNLKAFENPIYVKDYDDALNKLLNNKIDSFIIRDNNSPVNNDVNRLDLGDEVLYYKLNK